MSAGRGSRFVPTHEFAPFIILGGLVHSSGLVGDRRTGRLPPVLPTLSSAGAPSKRILRHTNIQPARAPDRVKHGSQSTYHINSALQRTIGQMLQILAFSPDPAFIATASASQPGNRACILCFAFWFLRGNRQGSVKNDLVV